ncbi:protein sprouty homolog 2 [Colossoma macropomum]|uniref:protein sprouty homolog 2 n=1 Tax=Colossoma macropomum TaxID=42526 RepID=UPI001863B21D|nr:protein sprouty homolog 2 [Colossoma macropomum]
METRAQSGGSTGSPEGGDGEEAREALVLPLHQIRTIHTSNEYTEGPVATSGYSRTVDLRPSGPSMDVGAVQDGTMPRESEDFQYTQNSRDFQDSRDSRDLQDSRDFRDSRDSSQGARSPQSAASRSTSGTSEGSCSNSSEQRLLGTISRTTGEPPAVVRVQPKRSEAKQEELKPLNTTAGSGKQHSQRCEHCHRCICEDCRSPRPLPSCWVCGRRCLCSAESTVDYFTCVCCLKALFYHCSTDDEDVCADKPFSCHQSHCCVRWSAAGALALILPCLLCYLPARGCLALCQACHDRAHRPGCRCKDTHVSRCKKNIK